MKYTKPEYEGATEEYIMDFDLIIPEPRFKKDCPKEFIRTEKSCVAEDKDRPWFNWYDWHCRYWNTKWNAYDGYTKIGATQLIFAFNTAWSIPDKVYEKLFAWCDEQGYDVEIRYADEDLGSNCGILSFDASEHNLTIQNGAELTNPVRFAKYIWDNY